MSADIRIRETVTANLVGDIERVVIGLRCARIEISTEYGTLTRLLTVGEGQAYAGRLHGRVQVLVTSSQLILLAA